MWKTWRLPSSLRYLMDMSTQLKQSKSVKINEEIGDILNN